MSEFCNVLKIVVGDVGGVVVVENLGDVYEQDNIYYC